MHTPLACGVVLILGLALVHGAAAEPKAEREVIQDNHFRRGFILWQPKPGKHVRYGELRGAEAEATPVWGLSQWSSKFPFDATASAASVSGFLIRSNSAKSVKLGQPGTSGADLSLAVNTGVEYGVKARRPGEPWVHLLVEQEFATPAPLEELSVAKFHLEARLLRSRNLHRDDYSIGGMNLGWELPGTFDVELEIRNLSLKLTEK